MKHFWKRPGFYVTLITAICAGFFYFSLYKIGILPVKFMIMIMVIFLLLLAIIGILWIRSDGGIISKIIGGVLAVALIISTGFGTYYVQVTYGALDLMTQQSDKTTKVTSVYVLNNGVITDAQGLQGRKIGKLNNINTAGTQGCLDALAAQGITIETQDYDSSVQMVNDLKGQAIDGVILDQGYLSTIEDMEGQENIREKIKPVFDYKYTVEKVDSASSVDTATQPFNILISGIDTFGAIEDTSRSDVNMIASVNPKTHTILLISIPRDFYVETACEPSMGCALGKMDKLTHTGLHGISTTEMTLEKLFGIEINYNIRVNFSSLIKIIDELGGVDVENVDSFTSLYKGYTFEPGTVHLDGDKALAFVRERYSFTDGDRERGKNQMRVVNALIDKAVSPAILNNFSGVMQAVGGSIQMNMSMKSLTGFVNQQISDGAKWNVYNYSVNGTGGTDFAYELGDNAYVMYPDQATINNAKVDIQAVINGEVPPYVNVT